MTDSNIDRNISHITLDPVTDDTVQVLNVSVQMQN